MKENRLRWLGHEMRREETEAVIAITRIKVEWRIQEKEYQKKTVGHD